MKSKSVSAFLVHAYWLCYYVGFAHGVVGVLQRASAMYLSVTTVTAVATVWGIAMLLAPVVFPLGGLDFMAETLFGVDLPNSIKLVLLWAYVVFVVNQCPPRSHASRARLSM